MSPHLDARYRDKGAIVHERETAAGLDPVPELFFLATLVDVRAVRVADCDADSATFASQRTAFDRVSDALP